MKKISTLGFGILISLASFANFAPSRLTVSAEGNTIIKVTLDGNRLDQQSTNSSVVFDNLQPGFHSVNVYQLTEKRFGFFGRKRGDDYKLIYSASVNIKPQFATSIALNRFGRAQINEQPIRGLYDIRRDDRGYDNDHTYNNNDHGYGNNRGYDKNSSYGRTISNTDFFAAQRVMDRENEDGRLLYAKRLIDDNYMCAEQVKELARFFTFDNSRLEFVKYAYGKTTDKGNFSVVCNAFSSNYGKDQVMNFLKTCR